MTDKIIQTHKREPRSPGAAFALSIFFTGLGQMYNGDLLKGAAFLLMRVSALLAVPAAMITRDPVSGITAFISLTAASLVITVASPVEALVRAKLNRELPVRAYNSVHAYAGYAIVQLFINIAVVLIMASFFTAGQVTDRRSEPLLENGDIVLIYRYEPHGYRRGDLVFLGDGGLGRVIALPGDAVRYTNNIFYINGRSLPFGYLPDDTISRFSVMREDVLSESNEGRKYPVRFKQSAAVTLQGMTPLVARGSVLVSADSRLVKDFARVIQADTIYGRIEGILFSSYLRKIGMDAFGNLK
jgi:signal peptidase I